MARMIWFGAQVQIQDEMARRRPTAAVRARRVQKCFEIWAGETGFPREIKLCSRRLIMTRTFRVLLAHAMTAAVAATTAFLVTMGPAWSQVVQPRTPGGAARDAKKEARDAGRDVRGPGAATRQEAREAGREARAEARADLR